MRKNARNKLLKQLPPEEWQTLAPLLELCQCQARPNVLLGDQQTCAHTRYALRHFNLIKVNLPANATFTTISSTQVCIEAHSYQSSKWCCCPEPYDE